MEDPEVRQRYLKRQGMVEPVFSQLKCRQGLRRFRRKGLQAVRCEFALHAMAYNLSRAMALWAWDITLIINMLSNYIISYERRGTVHTLAKRSFYNACTVTFSPA